MALLADVSQFWEEIGEAQAFYLELCNSQKATKITRSDKVFIKTLLCYSETN